MFVKITKSGPRQYVQIVEAYRDEKGKPRQRTLATLGRREQLNSLKAVHTGLSRILGMVKPESNKATPIFDSSRAFGDVWALTLIWKQMKLDSLREILRIRTRHKINLEALLRIMVLNRLCDADSKLGVLRWLQTVSFPNMDVVSVSHQQLLRTMDAIVENQEVIEKVLAEAVGEFVGEELSIIFYDLTTVRVEGEARLSGDVRRFGMSKDGVIARQFMLGLVQTADGVPLYHEVFEGNTAEIKTLKSSLEKALSRFPVKRVIAVADRGLLSIDNLEELKSIVLPGGQVLEFILAIPGRRYSEFAELLEPINEAARQSLKPEIFGECMWQDLRLVVAHNQLQAKEQRIKRDEQIASLERQAALWVGKLDMQDTGSRSRGRKLSDGGVRARFYHAVSEARLSRIIRVDLKSELFAYDIDHKALELARAIDGKLLLVSNTPDLCAHEIVDRYKSLADIERSFKVLKSEIEIGPVYHRLPERIRAHALICFMALVLHRIMRSRLQKQPVAKIVSPERALTSLRRIQTHRMTLQGQKTSVTGISTINEEQFAILRSIKVRKPTINDGYINL